MEAVQPYIQQIELVYPTLKDLSNDELRQKTFQIRLDIQKYVEDETNKISELKNSIEGQEIEQREKTYAEIDKLEKQKLEKYEEVLDKNLPTVFAIVKDTARRFSENEFIEVTATDLDRELATNHDFVHIDGDKAIYQNHWIAGGSEVKWNMTHYTVQMIGGTVLHKGKIAEMATGEGKTLVATLPVFLNALTGNGVHVITVNDYLSKRDSEWMGPLYMFHGLTVDCIDKHQPNSPARRKAYQADITFGTNNEFGFDYLRDNMATDVSELVQRGHNYAIVDEVDSVLIDDARTPLIIAGPVARNNDQMFEQFCPRIESIVAKQRALATNYLTEARKLLASDDKKKKEEGALALFRSYKALPKNTPLIKFLSEDGIRTILQNTEEYYLQDNSRNMPEATDPLYFVIDERHNSIELTDKGIAELTNASEDPNFFVLPDIGTEIASIEKSGDSDEEKAAKKEELIQNYGIKSERVHTVNQLLKAYTLFQKDDQYVVLNGEVKIVDEQTGRIMEGRRYSDGLHQAIEAKERVQVQAATQTYATITLQNYFRMYHKLAGMTGTAETEAGELMDIYKLDVVVIPTNKPIARKDLDDRVYRTNREKYKAVIEEIVSLREQGRPVLVGTTSVEISELLSRMLTMRNIQHNVLNAKQHQREAEIVALAGQKGAVTIATNMAGRGTDIKLSDEVREAGGLAIIGTERHESRRVDRQLRGRAGRQGDPGSSVFYVSLEDKLMRLFGSEKIAKVMDRMGFEEGEVIENPMISKSIERAQRKVEENHFGVRKRLLEYDDVMNAQREVIYRERRQTLHSERMGVNIMNMIFDVVAMTVEGSRDAQNYDQFKEDLIRYLALNTSVTEEQFRQMKEQELADKVFAEAMAKFKERTAKICEITKPYIKQVYEEMGERYQNMEFPIADGNRVYRIVANLKAAYESEGKELIKVFERIVLLRTIDEFWKEHLRDMDELRDSVQNASYEQKDPLLVYKLEAYELYRKMLQGKNQKSVSSLMRIQIPQMLSPEQAAAAQQQAMEMQARAEAQAKAAAEAQRRMMTEVKPDADDEAEAQKAAASAPQGQAPKMEPARSEKIGRNDPCPCGSGKKYKNCHGRGL